MTQFTTPQYQPSTPTPAPARATDTISIARFQELFEQVYKVDFEAGDGYHELVQHAGSGVSEVGEIRATQMQYVEETVRAVVAKDTALQTEPLSALMSNSDFVAKVSEGFQRLREERPEMADSLKGLASMEELLTSTAETNVALISGVWEKLDDLGMYNTGPGIHSAGRHEHRLTELRSAAEMLGSGDQEGARDAVEGVVRDLRAELEEVPTPHVGRLLAQYFGQMEDLLKANGLPVAGGSLQRMMDKLAENDKSVKIPISCLDEALRARNEETDPSKGTDRPRPDANFWLLICRDSCKRGDQRK